jgi:beta-lactamase class A
VTSVLTRRGLTLGMSVLLGPGALLAHAIPARAASTGPTAPTDPGTAIAAIEKRHGGRLGVFVLDTGSGRTLAHRADERFFLCSSFKGLLAAMILSRVDAGRDAPDRLVPFGPKDLVSHAPVASAHVAEGALPVGTLCAAILEFSDNTAANLLLARVGGPAGLTAYVRSLGDTETRIDSFEPVNTDRPRDRDITTPRAIVGLARTTVLGNALAPASRAWLEREMAANVAGRTRLRAAFPPAWSVADRTGTADGLCNDYAVARRPNRAPLVMAAYHDAPGMELERQEAVLREAGSAILFWAG